MPDADGVGSAFKEWSSVLVVYAVILWEHKQSHGDTISARSEM